MQWIQFSKEAIFAGWHTIYSCSESIICSFTHSRTSNSVLLYELRHRNTYQSPGNFTYLRLQLALNFLSVACAPSKGAKREAWERERPYFEYSLGQIPCGARLTRPQGPLMWRSALTTFPRTSLLLRLTIDLHWTIEQARAAHPIPNSKVKCRLAKSVLRWGISNIFLSYHCTQDSCPSGISPYGEIREAHLS